MGTRIAYLLVFAGFPVYVAREYPAVSLIYAGLSWTG
jgi:hypothetical protein